MPERSRQNQVTAVLRTRHELLDQLRQLRGRTEYKGANRNSIRPLLFGSTPYPLLRVIKTDLIIVAADSNALEYQLLFCGQVLGIRYFQWSDRPGPDELAFPGGREQVSIRRSEGIRWG